MTFHFISFQHLKIVLFLAVFPDVIIDDPLLTLRPLVDPEVILLLGPL